MQEFIFNLNSTCLTSNVIEAIKIFALTNESYPIYIIGGQTLISDLSKRNFKNISFIKDVNELALSNNQRVNIYFLLKEEVTKIEKDSFYILENKENNLCLLASIDPLETNLNASISKILNYKKICLKKSKKDTFKLLGSTQFVDEYEKLNLKDIPSYNGILDIDKLFDNDEELLIVDYRVLSIILKTLLSCQTYYTSQDTKSLASYFAKMTVQFQKTEKIFINNHFYETKCVINNKVLDLLISKDLSSSYIINTLNIIKN